MDATGAARRCAAVRSVRLTLGIPCRLVDNLSKAEKSTLFTNGASGVERIHWPKYNWYGAYSGLTPLHTQRLHLPDTSWMPGGVRRCTALLAMGLGHHFLRSAS